MPEWLIWLLGAWAVVSIVGALLFARVVRMFGASDSPAHPYVHRRVPRVAAPSERRRVLVVDDDPGLRLLLQTTLPSSEFAVREAATAEEASSVARLWRPDLVVLDVGLPGRSGLSLSSELTSREELDPTVILLTGAETSAAEAAAAGAAALLRKPFSPVELLELVDRTPELGDLVEIERQGAEQLIVYARDLSRLLEQERHARRRLLIGHRQAAKAVADALEARDPTTREHALRVQRYAVELTQAAAPALLDDPSLEEGFLLHDIGKVTIPDAILQKPGSLSESEHAVIRQHPLAGFEILRDIELVQGAGLQVVRSHHERWDGAGYPDALRGDEIPLAARVFAVADTLDAITSDRPYRDSRSWDDAVDEILAATGSQFDPRVVAAFARVESRIRRVYHELVPDAA